VRHAIQPQLPDAHDALSSDCDVDVLCVGSARSTDHTCAAHTVNSAERATLPLLRQWDAGGWRVDHRPDRRPSSARPTHQCLSPAG
jgi:hypothetical protein